MALESHTQLLTTAEVAALLRVPRRTVELWRWRRTGPPFVRLGRGVRYCVEDIEGYVRARRVGSRADDAPENSARRLRAALAGARKHVRALLDQAGGSRSPVQPAQRNLSSLLDVLDAALVDTGDIAERVQR